MQGSAVMQNTIVDFYGAPGLPCNYKAELLGIFICPKLSPRNPLPQLPGVMESCDTMPGHQKNDLKTAVLGSPQPVHSQGEGGGGLQQHT